MKLTAEQIELLLEEIAYRPIGSGYYSTSIDISEAREIVDAIVPLVEGWLALRTAELLDADELYNQPIFTVAIRKNGTEPRWRNDRGEWCLLGDGATRGISPVEYAPARVLWTPEASK